MTAEASESRPNTSRPRDEQAFTDFVRDTRGELLRYVSRRSAPGTDVEAIVQDIYELAWRRWSTIRSSRPWAFVVADNLVQHHERDRCLEVPFEILPDSAQWTSTARFADPHVAAEAALVRKEILRLPVRQKATVYLFHVSGWRQKDIARELGCSPKTVAVHAHRGTKKVRASLLALVRNHTERERGSASKKSVLVGALFCSAVYVVFIVCRSVHWPRELWPLIGGVGIALLTAATAPYAAKVLIHARRPRLSRRGPRLRRRGGLARWRGARRGFRTPG
jgi:RNA polymerase sigma factor (sigma-70 family)